MHLDLQELTQLAEIYKKLSGGYHISEQDLTLWQELDAQELSYGALFSGLGHTLKRDSRGFFYFDVDDASANMGKISRLFALTIYALVEYFADQGRDPLQALFDSELDHEVFSAIVQKQYHLFEQLDIFSATDVKREVANRMLRLGLARASGDNIKLLAPVHRYLDALLQLDDGAPQDSSDTVLLVDTPDTEEMSDV